MTRRDFEDIASLIRNTRSGNIHDEASAPRVCQTLEDVVRGLLPILRRSNPRFDAERFLKARGG